MFGYQEVIISETGTQFSGFVHLWVSSFLHVCGWNQWPEDWFKNASSSLGGLCCPYIQCYFLFFLLHGLSMAVKPPVGWQSSLCGRQVAWARGLRCSTLEALNLCCNRMNFLAVGWYCTPLPQWLAGAVEEGSPWLVKSEECAGYVKRKSVVAKWKLEEDLTVFSVPTFSVFILSKVKGWNVIKMWDIFLLGLTYISASIHMYLNRSVQLCV